MLLVISEVTYLLPQENTSHAKPTMSKKTWSEPTVYVMKYVYKLHTLQFSMWK